MIEVVDSEGMRLDRYLSETLELSRSKVQRLIQEEKVFVNGKKVNASYSVKIGDSIEVEEESDYEISVEPENIPLDIVYEDDDLLIINKPSGMVVHPAPGHYSKTLVNALLYHYPMIKGENLRPGIVHRLDKDTSGLMLVAKNEKTLEKLSQMIHDKKVERRYLAIVEGVIPHETGTVDAPIGRDPNNRQKQAVVENGKEAITHFKVIERFPKNTYIECILETGRTHQIRVHMNYIGYPVVNDPLYGKGKTEFGQMLHSYFIKLIHPMTGKELMFEQEIPEEFQKELNRLKEEI